MPYCRECGSQAAHTASYCSSCGTAIVLPRDFEPRSHRNRFVAAALAVVFGFFGVHHLYLGSYKRAALYMLFSWTTVPFFLGLYDAYRYVRADEAEFHRHFVVRENGHDEDADWTTDDDGTGDDARAEDDEARREAGEVVDPDEAPGVETVREGAIETEPSPSGGTSTAVADTHDGSSASPGGADEPETDEDPYLMKATGLDGEVRLYEDRVHIRREGRANRFLKPFTGGKIIPLDRITSIEFKKPGAIVTGYIEIGEDGQHGDRTHRVSENAVEFRREHQDAFERIRDALQTLSREEELASEALRKLFAAGAITEEEYRERKRVLEGE